MVVILDNRTTAMTGHQGHPGTGAAARPHPGPAGRHPEALRGHRRALRHRRRHRPQALDAAIKAEAGSPGLGVIVALAPCVLMTRDKPGEVVVDDERCNLCGVCVDVGCPALAPGEVAMSRLETCTGCGLCVEVCRRGALSLRRLARTSA